MFEIIMYLFENYLQAQSMPLLKSNELLDELELAGFKKIEIQKAFVWFAGLTQTSESVTHFQQQNDKNMRCYTLEEKQKLGRRCLGLLIYLEQTRIVNPSLRETIIDRAMAIESKRIEIEQLKWVIMMVLFHHIDDKSQAEPDLTWLENLLFAEFGCETLH